MSSTSYRAANRGRSGLTAAGGLALAFLVALAGAGLDLLISSGLHRGFAVALVIGAVLAAMLVRTRSLYPVVVSPPLIYLAISLLAALVTPTGAFDSKTRLLALLANWLVYGFPEMAAATGLAALIAVIRLISRR